MNSPGSNLKNLSFLIVFLHKFNKNNIIKILWLVNLNNDANYGYLKTLLEFSYNS